MAAKKPIKFNGREMSLSAWSVYLECSTVTLRKRLQEVEKGNETLEWAMMCKKDRQEDGSRRRAENLRIVCSQGIEAQQRERARLEELERVKEKALNSVIYGGLLAPGLNR